MAKKSCKRVSSAQIRKEILYVLNIADRELYASEIAQKIFELTRHSDCPVNISDERARKELRAMSDAYQIQERQLVKRFNGRQHVVSLYTYEN